MKCVESGLPADPIQLASVSGRRKSREAIHQTTRTENFSKKWDSNPEKGQFMKHLKKMMALVIAMVMIIGTMSMTAFAADPAGSITVKPSSTVTLADKTLKAYKILDATYGEATGTPAKQPVAYTIPTAMRSFFDSYFGQAADTTQDPPIAAKTATELAAAAGKTLDVYVTDIMKDWGDDSAKIKDFSVAALAAAKAANIAPTTGAKDGDNVKFSGLAAGYYVIEDEGTAVPISALMLDTVTDANVDITLKASDESKKEIMTAEDLVNSKANELGIGRAVNYKISQKIPDTTGYDYYYYMINDTLSTGLTFDPTTVVVKVGGTTLADGTDYYLYYVGDTHNTTATMLNGKTFIVAFKDIVADIADTSKTTFVKDAAVEITYSATVNGNAVVGVDPNNNKANVEFSNNPDKDGKGDFDTDHPGIPANDGNHPTGVGPDKWTDTYTEKVTILKKDGNTNEALPGVEFTLTGSSKDAAFNAEEVFEVDPTGEYWLLKNGTYTKTAPSTEPTLEATTRDAGWVEVGATETVAAGVPVRVVGSKTYRPFVKETDSAKTHYVIIETNTGDYTSTTTKYKKITKTADAAESYSVSRTGKTGDDGKLDFSQLGAGTYTLSENGVLAGYNAIPDITFTLNCQLPAVADVIAGTEKATWTITDVTPSNVSFVAQTDGTFQITIENNKGTELPSTGGIGTTIFYVIGAILVLGAGILLVTRRRMNAN